MKKMVFIFAAVLSAAGIMSCQKEVEIDGAVETEKTQYEYAYDVTGSYSKRSASSSYETGNVSDGFVSWDAYTNSNYMDYQVTLGYKAKNDIYPQAVSFSIRKIGGKFYFSRESYSSGFRSSDDFASTVTVTNPEEKSFTVKGSYLDRNDNLIDLDLKFTRK